MIMRDYEILTGNQKYTNVLSFNQIKRWLIEDKEKN